MGFLSTVIGKIMMINADGSLCDKIINYLQLALSHPDYYINAVCQMGDLQMEYFISNLDINIILIYIYIHTLYQ